MRGTRGSRKHSKDRFLQFLRKIFRKIHVKARNERIPDLQARLVFAIRIRRLSIRVSIGFFANLIFAGPVGIGLRFVFPIQFPKFYFGKFRLRQTHEFLGRKRHENVQDALFDLLFRLFFYVLQFPFPNELKRIFDELPNHTLHIPAIVSDLGVLGGLDFDERSLRQSGQTPRKFRFSNSRWADHQNVLRGDLPPKILRKLTSPPPIPYGNGDRPLCFRLSHDVCVQFPDDLARRHFFQIRIFCFIFRFKFHALPLRPPR